jgi:hypothetical protein
MPQQFARVLGDGRLTTSRAVLYTCPTRARAVISVITLVNLTEQQITLNLYLNPSGTPRRILSKDLWFKPHHLIETDVAYTLEPGNTIEGEAGTADAVEYTISGVEHR